MNRVVVTGIGVASAAALCVEEFWAKLLRGQSAVAPLQSFDATEMPTKIGAEIDLPAVEAHFPPKVSARLSRIAKMACYAAEQAIADAVGAGNALSAGAGVVIGASQGGFVESESVFNGYFARKAVSPFGILRPMNSAPATNISIRNNLRGPVLTIDTACSSANHAIGLAAMMIRCGNLTQAVVGGVDTPFSPAVFHNWCALFAMSRQNCQPQRACKPFSRNRDGTVLGEGAGMVVLESEASALARGAHIYGEIAGYGQSGDAFHLTQSTVDGMAAAIRHALQQAQIDPSQVDYISAHATATVANDAAESAAIRAVFGPAAGQIPVSGIKPVLGHTLAASAGFELIACLLAMRDDRLPPTINYEEADPACDLDYVTDGARTKEVAICLSNSFGFGGSNAVLVVKRYQP
jgi:3-oxoacyl-(acyl-carrier-protein) synthase